MCVIKCCLSKFSYTLKCFRSFRNRPKNNRENVISPGALSTNADNRRQIAQEQQVELINFSQNIHLLNQEVHKNLRRNKPGLRLEEIEVLPHDYRRPPGFVLVPGLLGTVPGGDDPMTHMYRKRTNSNEKLIESSFRDFTQNDPSR